VSILGEFKERLKLKTREFIRENHRWTGSGAGLVSGTLMTYLKRKAHERNLPFEITAEQLWNLFLKQEERCALSGVPITLSRVINKQNNLDRTLITASLDRIDNSKGYYIDNVQWIHKILNHMRRQYSVEEYVHWCTLVANHANLERSSVNANKVTENVQRLGSEEATNNLPKSAQPLIIEGEDIV
jgi:hypothetical protein